MKKTCALILFIALFARVTVYAQVDTVSNLSNADKLYGLSKFWSEAKYNFAFFDHAKINWDSTYQAYIPKVLATKNTWEYYKVMKRFCAMLKDGHTNVYEPGSLYKKSRYKYLVVENFDHHFYVTNVPVQVKDEVPMGSEVMSVDGRDIQEYVKNELMPYISASAPQQLWNDAASMMFYGTDTAKVTHLTLKTPKGKLVKYDYQFHTYGAKWERPRPAYQRFEFKKIDDIGYVKINTFGDEKVIADFKAILPDLYNCKGVIIDIRSNGGGSTDIGAEILKYFTDQKMLVGSKWRTRDYLPSFRAWGEFQLKDTTKFEHLDAFTKKTVLVAKNDYWFYGDTSKFNNDVTAQKITVPLVVLTSNYTASAAEDFLIILDGLKGRATTIGQRTFGSTGQPLQFDLPGGGGARVCTKRDTYPDGREFVGSGVKPDIEIKRNVNDIIAGKDTELEAALKEIKKQIK